MPPAQRHPTMADVAERAGVSVSTVSRTLRGLSTVSDDARTRVEAAASELSFVISRQASSLVTGKTGTVAVLAPTLGSWFVGQVLRGLSEVLRDAGLDLKVYSVGDLAERAAFFDRLPARRNADALLVISFDLTEEEFARLDGLGVPVVYVSQHAPGRASVYVEDVAAARGGTRYLRGLGHRRIGFVRAAPDSGFTCSSRTRLFGYREALAEAALPYDEELVVATSRGRRATSEAVGQLLCLADPPTAVFAETDEIAIEVLSVLRSSGIAVPDRLSVLGFDDHDHAQWLDLTTIAQPATEVGRAAGSLAHTLIDDPTADPAHHVVLPTHLIPRGSTGPAPEPEVGAAVLTPPVRQDSSTAPARTDALKARERHRTR
ncbi:LacI family DNA-binding transcriptional regulator [Streptomyces sp. NPDC053560]|uniref:LacI family DNA-binding transcriptional regulator n=1 Tax=Streptomyces sp. NPDC053560 TaxID=3365711 RepID=UPI0037D0A0EC